MTFIQAAHFYAGRRKPIRLLVLHDMEAPEKATTAEDVARYFARADSRKASAHYTIDSDSIVQCVRDGDTAWAAEGANADGLHFELAGYARQTPAEWVDAYGKQMLKQAAYLVAAKAIAYGIPIRRLTPQQVRDGEPGICGHGDVTAAFPPGTGHTDPGQGFPWTWFLDLVRAAQAAHTPKPPPQEDEMTPQDLETIRNMIRTVLGNPGPQDADETHDSLGDIRRDLREIKTKLGIPS